MYRLNDNEAIIFTQANFHILCGRSVVCWAWCNLCWSTFFPISYRSDTQCVEIIYEQEIPILGQNSYGSISSQTTDEIFILQVRLSQHEFMKSSIFQKMTQRIWRISAFRVFAINFLDHFLENWWSHKSILT